MPIGMGQYLLIASTAIPVKSSLIIIISTRFFNGGHKEPVWTLVGICPAAPRLRSVKITPSGH